MSDPTWPNHYRVFRDAGFTNQPKYPYFKADTNSLDFPGMIECLSKAPKGAIVLLHACAHNPTGVDPTKEQWGEILKVIKEKQLFTFFDSAYQGYASGNLDNDAYAIRLFAREGVQFVCAQSFAKNLGLYGERVGGIHMACDSKETATKVMSQVKLVVRGIYSNPPIHGARIVSRVISNPANFEQWKTELKAVSERIALMRKMLYEELVKIGTPGNWEHVINQIGMFSYTGLTSNRIYLIFPSRPVPSPD